MRDDMGTAINFLLKATKGSFKSLLKDMVPTGLKDQIALAYGYASGDSELIQAIIETKRDFYAAGFSIAVKARNENNKKRMEERINEMIREHEIKKIAEELTFDFTATDNCILQWKVTGSSLDYVTTINPSKVKYEISPGHEKLSVEMAADTISHIRNCLGDKKKLAELQRSFPQKYIDAVNRGDRYVELKNDDGEYWVIRTKNRRFSGLSRPSMYAIFDDILLRELLIGGDWSVAYFIRRVIEHVKMGEKAPAGQINDLKALYPTEPQMRQLQEHFQKLGDTMRLFTDHTVNIDYKFPDPKVMDPLKFKKVEERIHRWGAVVQVLMTGEGEGFSQGHLGARRFVAQGHAVREAIGDVFEKFLLHESMSGVLGIPSGSTANCSWDEQNLKDPKQVLEELNSMWDRGCGDIQTYVEMLGYNYEIISGRKERDAKEKKKWVPTFEPRQGLLSNPTGRPGDGKPKDAPTDRPKPKNKGV